MRLTRNLLLAATTVFLAFSTGFAAPAEDGLRIVDQAWLKAALANDLEGIVALYAPDARMYPPDSMEAKGKEAIRASWKAFLDPMTIKKVTLSDEMYTTSGDLSAGAGRWTIVAAPKAGGPEVTMEGRATSVARKIDGKWLYILDHASVPIPPPGKEEDDDTDED